MQRILIIDRDEGIRETLGAYSEMLGYEPILVSDPTLCNALNQDKMQCQVEKPCTDILLVGQGLSSVTGLQVVATQNEKGCRLPAHRKAVLSGRFTKEEFMQSRQLGCHVLQKPVTYEILANWLNGLSDDLA